MSYTVDKSLLWSNVIIFTSDSGTKYSIRLVETTRGSGLWTLEFNLISGSPDNSEVFSTMSTLYNVLTGSGGLIEKTNATNILFYIAGNNRDEIDQKTNVFTRWIKSPWEYKIDYNPEVTIQGKRDKLYPNTNFIYMKKTENITISPTASNVKYCYNCGSVNNNYKFCPNCGTNLQQA